jgi:hypothetical protein
VVVVVAFMPIIRDYLEAAAAEQELPQLPIIRAVAEVVQAELVIMHRVRYNHLL